MFHGKLFTWSLFGLPALMLCSAPAMAGGHGGPGFHGGHGHCYRGYGYGGYGFGPGLGFGLGLGLGLGATYPLYAGPRVVVVGAPTAVVVPAPVQTVVTAVPASPALPQTAPPPLAQPPVESVPTLPTPYSDNRGHIELRVPANAAVWIAGRPTTQTGPVRQFASPEIPAGQVYSYEVKARWEDDEGPVEQTRQVKVRANQTSRLTFGASGRPND